FDFEHFEISRAIAIRHHMKFVKRIGKRDAIENFRKEINSRRAKQFEAGAINAAFERGFLLFERNGQIELIAFIFLRRLSQPGEPEKQVSLRQRKIFAKEAITLETARAGWQKRFLR